MIRIHRLAYTYPGSDRPALQEIDLEIQPGELVLVCGPSGSGKSTLLRCLNGLVPHFSGGSLQGRLQVAGLDPVQVGPQGMSRVVGFVFQDPEAQIVLDRVEAEIAFSLENAGLPFAEMQARLQESLARLGLPGDRRVESLSGGERQQVALAAALALRPQLLILDEPTSQLDPQAADALLGALVRLNQELGLTIVLAEHRLERVLPFAHRLVYLESEPTPRLLSGPPRQLCSQISLQTPLTALAQSLGWDPLPLSVEEARPRAQALLAAAPAPAAAAPPAAQARRPLLQAEGVHLAYGAQPVLRGVDLALYPGEILALVGANGAGKTSLLRALVGLAPVRQGRILLEGQEIAGRSTAEICRRAAYLPQDPNAMLFADTLADELRITLRNHRLSPADYDPAALLEQLGLDGLSASYPRDLSAGQRQRAALGAILVTRPAVILLDEPTRGLDLGAKQSLGDLLRRLRQAGSGVLLATHDVELVAGLADRVAVLAGGQIQHSGPPEVALEHSPVFAPQMLRLFPGRGWLTAAAAFQGLTTRKLSNNTSTPGSA